MAAGCCECRWQSKCTSSHDAALYGQAAPVTEDHRADEWGFLTFDPDETCSVCGEPIRAAQAVGYHDGGLVHARCCPPASKAA
jgi:hypothetical protein